MKLFMFCVVLLYITMAAAAPVRARRENVLSFLNVVLGTTTEKTMPAQTTAYRWPASNPVREHDSGDMSEAKSTEIFNTNGFIDPDSHEATIRKVMETDKAPSRRNTGVDQGSREQSGPQVSRERTDLNSEEGTMMENLSGKRAIRLSGDQVSGSQGSSLPRKAAPGRVNGSYGMMTPGRSRELLDLDSLEGTNGRPAPAGIRGDIDYDETREFISSEIYPVAPPQHTVSGSSVAAKSRAS